MHIAFTHGTKPGETDRVLASLAEQLLAKGYKLAGIVQQNSGSAEHHKCDMDAVVLPDGPIIRISQSLGANARGCRLDPNGLEQAAMEVDRRLGDSPDLLIVNKFGKHEASGGGFRPLIARAIELDIPVITGTNGLNEEAFLTFTGGTANWVGPAPQSLMSWFEAVYADGASPTPAALHR